MDEELSALIDGILATVLYRLRLGWQYSGGALIAASDDLKSAAWMRGNVYCRLLCHSFNSVSEFVTDTLQFTKNNPDKQMI